MNIRIRDIINAQLLRMRQLQPDLSGNSLQIYQYKYILTMFGDERYRMSKYQTLQHRKGIQSYQDVELRDNELFEGITFGERDDYTVYYNVSKIEYHARRIKENVYPPTEALRAEVPQMAAPILENSPIQPFLIDYCAETTATVLPQSYFLAD